MTIDNLEDYIKYRFIRAEESLDDAYILAQNNKWNTVANRLYYSCFYAVSALLLRHNIETKSHEGTRTQFGLQFIKPGLINKKFGKLYSKLFDYRQKGDYGDLYDFDKETIEPLIGPVKEFIKEIKIHINR